MCSSSSRLRTRRSSSSRIAAPDQVALCPVWMVGARGNLIARRIYQRRANLDTVVPGQDARAAGYRVGSTRASV
jgi:hypothetical protein